MRNIFKKTTQNNKQSDYVLRRPRYSGVSSEEFPSARTEADVSLGWDPNARSEHDGARHGEKIFQEKNTFDPSRDQEIFQQKNIIDPSSEFFRLVKSGWDPTARTEADELSRVQKIFQQKNTCEAGLRRNDRSRAFTLVETLVAISILMLSVSGPLYYASESLKAAIYARDQITAFYLAQDAFEQIRKIRDNNTYFLDSTYSWNNGLIGCEDDIVAKCVIAKSPSLLYTLSPGIDEADTFLYRDANGLYSHDTGGTKTIFKRMIKIEPTNGDPILTDWLKATEMKVTVFIKWNSRGSDRDFTAYEFLRNFKD